MKLIRITTTSDSREELDRIATRLIQQNLAACCQLSGPITSVYRWQGVVETAKEWQCTIKTRSEHFDRVAAVITELHHYSVPQIVATDICQVSGEFHNWICDQTNVSSANDV